MYIAKNYILYIVCIPLLHTGGSVRACTSCRPFVITSKEKGVVAKHRFVQKISVLSKYIHSTLTKPYKNELPSVKAAHLVNNLVLASVYLSLIHISEPTRPY